MASRYSTKKVKAQKQTTPLLIILGGVLILAVAVVILVLSRPSTSPVVTGNGGQPALAADVQVIDLGDVKLGQYVQASFTLTNTGNTLLTFTDDPYIEVKEGC